MEGKVRCHIGLRKSAGRRMKCGPEEASFFGVSERAEVKSHGVGSAVPTLRKVREGWGSRSTGGIKEVQKLAKFRGRATRRVRSTTTQITVAGVAAPRISQQ